MGIVKRLGDNTELSTIERGSTRYAMRYFGCYSMALLVQLAMGS
jgi:hypothetical protein